MSGPIPVEKIYLVTDKQLYSSDQMIYYKLYLLDGQSHTPSDLSGVANVELLLGDELIAKHTLKIKEGTSHGEIVLADTLLSGKYTIQAYTHYQLNFDDRYVFSKEIEIIGASTNATFLESDQLYDFQVFPEGGYFVLNEPNIAGFKCVNSKGQGIEVKGALLQDRDTIQLLESFHNGMGKFLFTPKKNAKYRIDYSIGDKIFSYKLKDIQETGYRIMVLRDSEFAKVIVAKNSDELTFDNSFLLVRMRGRVLSVLPPTTENYFFYEIPSQELETGIVALTFMKDSQPLLERIYFNDNPASNIELSHNPLDSKSDSTLSFALDLVGVDSLLSTGAEASISVLRKESRKPGISIRSHLLLTSEIRGTIENPEEYFDKKDPRREQKLDVLMLTQGWRKYNWNEYDLEKQVEDNWIKPKRGLFIKGVMKDIYSGYGVAKTGRVYALEDPTFSLEFETDSKGFFEINGLDIADSATLIIQATKQKKVRGEKVGVLDQSVNVEISSSSHKLFTPKVITVEKREKYQTSEYDLSQLENVRVLEDITVTAKKRREDDPFDRARFYGQPNRRFVMDSLPGVPPLLEIKTFITRVIPSVQIGRGARPGEEVLIYRGFPIRVLWDGVPVSLDALQGIDGSQVQFIDLVYGYKAAILGGPAIALYSYTGPNPNTRSSGGSDYITMAGYQKPKEFYLPKYEEVRSNYLTTINWIPYVKFEDSSYELTFTDYKLNTGYLVWIEGITRTGAPFVYSFTTSNTSANP